MACLAEFDELALALSTVWCHHETLGANHESGNTSKRMRNQVTHFYFYLYLQIECVFYKVHKTHSKGAR